MALHPTGWEDNHVFALTVPDDLAPPQRMVAYGNTTDGVLQVVDLTKRFGSDWIPTGSDCTDRPLGTVQLPDADTTISIGADWAKADQQLAGATARNVCLPLHSGLNAVTAGPRRVVVVVGPEVETVDLVGENSIVESSSPPTEVNGTLWKVVLLHTVRDVRPDDRIVTRDTVQTLGQLDVGAALSP